MDCHPPTGEIKAVAPEDFPAIYEIINDAAHAYQGIIPADRWHEPYMTREALAREMDEGVVFSGYYAGGRLVGVMGTQDKGEVVLIRHAYVRTSMRNGGIGGRLLEHLLARRDNPVFTRRDSISA